MFKYLLLKTIYDISDVDVVERSQYDMSFKYFLGMAPEEGVINPSSLCKFRKMRLKDMDLLTLLIKKTVSLAVEKGVITSRTIIVDATHTASRSNPYSPIELLKLRSKQLRKALYEVDEAIKDSLPQKNEDDDLSRELDYTQRLLSTIEDNQSMSNIPAVKQRLNMLRETLDDIQDHYTTSIDEDARVGHKSEDSSFFGYKTHIAMSDERIITAAIVTSEIKETAPIELIGGRAEITVCRSIPLLVIPYSGNENLKLAEDEEKGFELISRIHPIISNGFRKEDDKFDFNKDAGMFVCPAGHMAIRKAKQGKSDGKWNQTWTYYFDVEKCKVCSWRKGCYKNGAKSKTYSVSIKTSQQETQLEYQQTKILKQKPGKDIRLKPRILN